MFDLTERIRSRFQNRNHSAGLHGAAITWSAWIKPTANQPNATIFRSAKVSLSAQTTEFRSWKSNGTRTAGAPPMAPNSWHHLAVTVTGSTITLYIDGQSAATFNAALPASTAPLSIGGDPNGGGGGFSGEMDELEISKAARPAGLIKIAAMSQGPDKASKLLIFADG